MALMAHDASDLLDQLILVTHRLTEITELQSKLFAESKFAEVAPLNDEAGRLAATYAIESQRIAKNPAILSGAAQNLKDALARETEKFRNAMLIHESTIARGMHLAEGLVKAIAEEAMSHRPTPIAYGPKATRGGDNIKRDASAIALDRRA